MSNALFLKIRKHNVLFDTSFVTHCFIKGGKQENINARTQFPCYLNFGCIIFALLTFMKLILKIIIEMDLLPQNKLPTYCYPNMSFFLRTKIIEIYSFAMELWVGNVNFYCWQVLTIDNVEKM